MRSSKEQLFAFVLLNVVILSLLVIWLRRPAVPPFEVREQRLRINGLIATIKQETWNQTIENILTNADQFVQLGVVSDIGGEELVLEQMLSARRSIKVLNTLQELPTNDRVKECKELFNRIMRVYEDVVESGLGKWEAAGEAKYLPRHALCLVMLATAETGRRDILAEEFQKLDELRNRIEKRINENEAVFTQVVRKAGLNFEVWKRFRLEICAPEARFQVNVLRQVVVRDPQATNLLRQIDEYCRSRNMRTSEVPVVPWNARTTRFEGLVGSGVDTSKGVTKYSFYYWDSEAMSEALFGKDDLKRETLQKIRELALGSLK